MGCCSSEEEGPINPNQVDQSHFTMMKVVGKGGFGKVNAVTHRTSGKLMAMKRMKKSKLVSKKMYIITAWRERDVMAQLKSPFLVNLEYAFQDKVNLFLIMPFMQGGDLRYYLNTRGKLTEDQCRFYAAEMILGLEELHNLHIVYRDLKPDNVLLDSEGHLRISDFGLAVILRAEDDYKVTGGAGTPGYQAPEVLQRQPYGVSADIWSLGITIYEFLERSRPFHTPEEVVHQNRIKFDPERTPECKDLIRRLLAKEPRDRLGCGPTGITEIKSHPWFTSVDWDAIQNLKVKPPHQPELDRANCSADFELQDQFFSEKKEPDLTEAQQSHFRSYEFNVDLIPKDVTNNTGGDTKAVMSASNNKQRTSSVPSDSKHVTEHELPQRLGSKRLADDLPDDPVDEADQQSEAV